MAGRQAQGVRSARAQLRPQGLHRRRRSPPPTLPPSPRCPIRSRAASTARTPSSPPFTSSDAPAGSCHTPPTGADLARRPTCRGSAHRPLAPALPPALTSTCLPHVPACLPPLTSHAGTPRLRPPTPLPRLVHRAHRRKPKPRDGVLDPQDAGRHRHWQPCQRGGGARRARQLWHAHLHAPRLPQPQTLQLRRRAVALAARERQP
ncbi:hypothetical protein BS78_01G133900 [Paspalum vaginatum]|nr:hypothetical protein BS78_01G133900 [Paspalum vaginatum]